MKNFCKDFKVHVAEIINYEKTEMIPWTYEENQKVCYMCKKELSTDDKKYYKVRGHSNYTGKYIGAARNICNLRHKAPKKSSCSIS